MRAKGKRDRVSIATMIANYAKAMRAKSYKARYKAGVKCSKRHKR